MINLRIYKKIFLVNWQDCIAYRASFFVWSFASVLPFIVLFFLWTFVYKDMNSYAGFDIKSLITYYFAALVAQKFSSSSLSWMLNNDIRDGRLNKYLIKPFGHLKTLITIEISDRFFFIGTTAPFLVLFYLIFNNYLLTPSLEGLMLFLFTALLGYIIFMSFSVIIGSLAFWFDDGSGFIFAVHNVMFFLTGAMIPFEFFGERAEKVLSSLPFSYVVSFPVNIYLNRFSGSVIFLGIVKEFFWIAVFVLLARSIYNAGLKKHSAVGG